ncbi:ClpP/crotonase-like domain-containing protein [Hysterangium stoloniferum]|nr:ClpP/crotonase-like domain-containing protein [Hysterangium stoloniferum]
MYPLHFPSSTDSILTLSNPKPYIWVLEMHNGVDSRLTPHFLMDAFIPALDHVELAWRNQWKAANEGGRTDPSNGRGALVITGSLAQDKFFSNGLDLNLSLSLPGFFSNIFNPIIIRLTTFPIPTVASINGHLFAGGYILAAACDYRVCKNGKLWGCMNEVHFGSDFPPTTLLFLQTRAQHQGPSTMRKLIQEGHRWTSMEMLDVGMVDEVVEIFAGWVPSVHTFRFSYSGIGSSRPSEQVLRRALQVAEKKSEDARTGVYGFLKVGNLSIEQLLVRNHGSRNLARQITYLIPFWFTSPKNIIVSFIIVFLRRLITDSPFRPVLMTPSSEVPPSILQSASQPTRTTEKLFY